MDWLFGFATWLAGWFAKLAESAVVRFTVFKTILWSIFGIILPSVIYKLITSIFEEVMNYATSLIQTNLSLPVLNFVGLMGWFVDNLYLPACFTVILSALVVRFVISFIPFVGPK